MILSGGALTYYLMTCSAGSHKDDPILNFTISVSQRKDVVNKNKPSRCLYFAIFNLKLLACYIDDVLVAGRRILPNRGVASRPASASRNEAQY